MKNYQVFMPSNKRVYNVYMPANKRVYNVNLPGEVCLEGGANLIASPKDFTTWNQNGTVSIDGNFSVSPGGAQDADRMDITGSTSTVWYEDTGLIGSAALDAQIWFKLTSAVGGDTLRLLNPYSQPFGLWFIDMTHPSLSAWQLLTPSHPAVTESNSFRIESAGRLAIGFSPSTPGLQVVADLWCCDVRYQ